MSKSGGPSLSTQCRDALLTSLQSQFGEIAKIRGQIHSKKSNILDRVLPWLDQQAPGLLAPILANHSVDHFFIERVKQTAIEEIYSERLHPTLRLAPSPLVAPVCDTVHCLLFDQLPNAYNELFPLMLDSYIADLERYGEARRLVVAAHVDWLNKNSNILRGAFYSPEDDEVVETAFECELCFDSVHYLCISPQGHEAASRRLKPLNLIEVNPAQISSQMDDKYECCQKWLNRGVPTPPAALLKQGETSGAEVQQALQLLFDASPPESALVVAQPNQGTEGRGVKAFRIGNNDERAALIKHIQTIGKADGVLLRRGVEGVYLLNHMTRERSLFDIRITVASGVAESGYIQSAAKNAVIASPSQGGRIVEWKALDAYLIESDGETTPFDLSLLRKIQFTAVQAVRTFGDGTMAGVDLRLGPTRGEKRFEAWVLDVNPRPAGLGRSCFWNGEPGVTHRLWLQLPSID